MLEQPAAGANASTSAVTSSPSIAREMAQLQKAADLARDARGQHHARVAERQAQVVPQARYARFVHADRAVIGLWQRDEQAAEAKAHSARDHAHFEARGDCGASVNAPIEQRAP